MSCCPTADASINMIPIVLASVLIASGKNIWRSLILCVTVSVCLQVCVSVRRQKTAQGAGSAWFFIKKKNNAVCA